MLSSTFAPAAACLEGGPSGSQMSSHIEMPTTTPPMSQTRSGAAPTEK